MAFHFERDAGKKAESTSGHESDLHKTFDYSRDRIKVALEAHTVLSEETKQMVVKSLDKASANAFMSDVLDRSLADRYDGKDDEQKATQWLVNMVAEDVTARFAQNADRYADTKQANALLTFLRGTLHRQPL